MKSTLKSELKKEILLAKKNGDEEITIRTAQMEEAIAEDEKERPWLQLEDFVAEFAKDIGVKYGFIPGGRHVVFTLKSK